MITLTTLLYNRLCLAFSFGPECWPSSGHYPRIGKYTETVMCLKVDVTVNAKVWTRFK